MKGQGLFFKEMLLATFFLSSKCQTLIGLSAAKTKAQLYSKSLKKSLN